MVPCSAAVIVMVSLQRERSYNVKILVKIFPHKAGKSHIRVKL
jgi:hypothetical protein